VPWLYIDYRGNFIKDTRNMAPIKEKTDEKNNSKDSN